MQPEAATIGQIRTLRILSAEAGRRTRAKEQMTTTAVAESIDQFRERFTRITQEVGRRIVGHEEIVNGTVTSLLAGGHVLLEGHSRRRQDEPRAHARRRAAPEVLAHPVHARPDARRHRRHQHRAGALARRHVLRVPAGPDLRQRRARRRDQPRDAEDAVGAARSDAGRQRLGRQDDLPARAAVPGAGDAEPAGDGRHVSAARSAARSLLLQAEGDVSVRRGDARDPRADDAATPT